MHRLPAPRPEPALTGKSRRPPTSREFQRNLIHSSVWATACVHPASIPSRLLHTARVLSSLTIWASSWSVICQQPESEPETHQQDFQTKESLSTPPDQTVLSQALLKPITLKRKHRASLVAQWLRIRLPMQGTRVRALVREDATCRRATKPVHHNY